MKVDTEYALKLGGSSELAGIIIDLTPNEEWFIENPEEALPHTVVSARVYREPWKKHVYYPPVPMA
jgi:hypothetical protein